MNDGNNNMEKVFTPDMQKAYEHFKTLQKTLPLTQWEPQWIAGLKILAGKLAEHQFVPFFPPIVYIEPTNACNCRCIICPRRQMTRPLGYLDMDLFRKIIDDIALQGPSDIRLFNFGEPLLHPDLAEMVRYCRMKELSVRFQSNGLLLKENQIQALLDAGLEYIGISVNGLNADEYERIRPGKKYAELHANVKQLHAIAHDRKSNLHIHINAQILKDESETRKAEIRSFVQSWHGIADSLSVSGLSLYDQIAYVHNGIITEATLAEIPRKADDEVRCTEPFDRMIVKWDGRVTPCCVDFDAESVVGDLTRQTLEEVWQSKSFNNLRSIIRDQQYSKSSLCRTCPLFYSDPFTILFKKQSA